MKPKKSIIPKTKTRVHEAPDSRVYRTKSGERVCIAKSKMFPICPADAPWRRQMQAESNERPVVVRISDGHELWGCKIEDLTLES